MNGGGGRRRIGGRPFTIFGLEDIIDVKKPFDPHTNIGILQAVGHDGYR